MKLRMDYGDGCNSITKCTYSYIYSVEMKYYCLWHWTICSNEGSLFTICTISLYTLVSLSCICVTNSCPFTTTIRDRPLSVTVAMVSD